MKKLINRTIEFLSFPYGLSVKTDLFSVRTFVLTLILVLPSFFDFRTSSNLTKSDTLITLAALSNFLVLLTLLTIINVRNLGFRGIFTSIGQLYFSILLSNLYALIYMFFALAVAIILTPIFDFVWTDVNPHIISYRNTIFFFNYFLLLNTIVYSFKKL